MYQINYDGWLCGNDKHPIRFANKVKDKIGVEVYGLNSLLKKIVEFEDNWTYVDDEYRIKKTIGNTNMSMKAWDHYIKIDERNILVEFDGYHHYTKINNFIIDSKYELGAKQLGYEVIRIPYFIQLDTELINYYFNTKLMNTKITHSFLQGFRINGKIEIPEFKGTKADAFRNTLKYKLFLPTEFHQFGLMRFEKEMQQLSQNGLVNVVDEIIESLKCRASENDWDEKYVTPNIKWK